MGNRAPTAPCQRCGQLMAFSEAKPHYMVPFETLVESWAEERGIDIEDVRMTDGLGRVLKSTN